MNNDLAKSALQAAKAIQISASNSSGPPDEVSKPRNEKVIASSILRKSNRSYIQSVVHQINLTYEHACYDACAVMIRRLLETLIIEAFEKHNVADKIKNQNGDFLYLGDLVANALSETVWNLSRNTKKSLPKLKNIGDLSAHNRRFNAHRQDIDKITDDLRVVVQEFAHLAYA